MNCRAKVRASTTKLLLLLLLLLLLVVVVLGRWVELGQLKEHRDSALVHQLAGAGAGAARQQQQRRGCVAGEVTPDGQLPLPLDVRLVLVVLRRGLFVVVVVVAACVAELAPAEALPTRGAPLPRSWR